MGVCRSFDDAAEAIVFHGDCLDLLRDIPDGSVQLVVTSPPYNIGKDYEKLSALEFREYWRKQQQVLKACTRVLSKRGSLCWQLGNYVEKGNGKTSIVPLDIVLHPILRR